jgi:hypothetical protein
MNMPKVLYYCCLGIVLSGFEMGPVVPYYCWHNICVHIIIIIIIIIIIKSTYASR